jgi:Fic family protein
VVKSSEIEGEKLDVETVRSSIARRMGLDIGALRPIDRNVEGIVDIMLDATRKHDKPLTQERLFDWHGALFPTGRSGLQKITTAAWRKKEGGAMQVVFGVIGREKVHFEAPEAERLKGEMSAFVKWFNAEDQTDLVLKSALAHFWFVTIHPFKDGNGRIARAIADMMLARSENTPQRFYSMSAQIQQERSAYYEVLEKSQKGTLDITRWLEWYLNCLRRAINASDKLLESILVKDRFWKVHQGESFNERQRKVINRLLDGFEGKLTSSKWAKLAKCSQDTAGRDINDLLYRKILVKEEAGGRSTSYILKSPSRA